MYGVFYNTRMKKKIITEDMISDFGKMCDKDFKKKWSVSLPWIIRERRKLGIKPYLNQHGGRGHKFINGVEMKWCPKEGGHFVPLTEFGKGNNRPDGLRGVCNKHEKESRNTDEQRKMMAARARVWRKTDVGKKSLRNTWRKEKAKKDNAFIRWSINDEISAYEIFNRKCAYCGVDVDFFNLEFDHFIPISKGGKTEVGNMIPSCAMCNRGAGGKFNKEPENWIRERFSPEYAKEIYKNCVEKLKELALRSELHWEK